MITINPNPLMTQFLVKEGVFRDEPFVLVDVGARGGLAPHWDVLNPYMRAYCFEPDAAECARLNASAPAHMTYIPKGLWHTAGKQTLYVTRLADSSGLYRNGEYFNRLVNAGNGQVVEEREIECERLQALVEDAEIPQPDFLKLDAEGAEGDILWGSPKVASGVLGLITEIRFHKEINGCAPFSSMDGILRKSGLHLYDLTFGYQSRKDLPYPQTHNSVAQDGHKFMGLTTRGQIQDGDALYFRDLLLPIDNPAIHSMSTIQILKMACLLEIYSLNDCAAELILSKRALAEDGRVLFEGGWIEINNGREALRASQLLDLLASGMAGQATTYEVYRKAYFGA